MTEHHFTPPPKMPPLHLISPCFRPLLALCTLAALATQAPLALAQNTVPDAGQLLQQAQPPSVPVQPQAPVSPLPQQAAPLATPEGGDGVLVRRFVLDGVSALPEAELQTLLAPALDQTLTLADLQRLCAQLGQHYRAAGYFVAAAYLPAQQVADGVVRITVQEGRLDRVRAQAAGWGGQALAPLHALPPGTVLREATLLPVLLALRDLPGVQVQTMLSPGQTPGASELLVDVQPGQALEGGVELDNQGNGATGKQRVAGNLTLNNPLQWGDQLTLRALTAGAGLQSLTLGYQLPLGASATRVGLSTSAMHYQLGHSFAALDAGGQSRTLSLYLRHPLQRSLQGRLDLLMQLDAKDLTDRVRSTQTVNQTRIVVPSVALNAQWQDAWWNAQGASSQASVGVGRGRLGLDAASLAQDLAGPRATEGHTKLSLSAQRWQDLGAGWSLLVTARGQASSANLPSAERLSLGGAQGVRAYADGAASGDEGWLGRAELRRQIDAQWQALAFADAGRVKVHARPWDAAAPNRQHLAGAGVGAQWTQGPWSASLNAAWAVNRNGSSAPSTEPGPRLWLQAGWRF
jgi:hemolysin activation/secretion protein